MQWATYNTQVQAFDCDKLNYNNGRYQIHKRRDEIMQKEKKVHQLEKQ